MSVTKLSDDSYFIRAMKGNLVVSRFYFQMSLEDAVKCFKLTYKAEATS